MAAKRKPRPKASGLAPSATAGAGKTGGGAAGAGAASSASNRAARPQQGKSAKASGAKVIPPAVANRMARRIALATGVPSVLGMSAFVVSYLLVSRNIYDVPPVLTLAVSGGLFLLGVLGLSYGVLSASWEDAAGSLLGFEQIGVNISRVRASIRAMRQGSNAPS